jgi:S1-C subfamily serine protease
MSTVEGQYAPYDPAQPPPPPAWHPAGWSTGADEPESGEGEEWHGGGSGGRPPGWHDGGTGGWHGEGSGDLPPGLQGKPRRRRGPIVAAAAVAVALAAGGTAWATVGSSGPLSTAQIASQVSPGLVDVTSTLGYAGGVAEGTGMVLTSSGEVLTNNHVIAGATSIKVRDVGNGRTYTATVVGYSDSDDVAVLQLQGASGLATVSVGNSSSVAAGNDVVALGNAEGKGGSPAVVTGNVTGLGATITAEDQDSGNAEHLTDMIRTNANIEPGDSGGPLVNTTGQVIGMDTAASTASPGQVGTTAATATTAFSIPINRAMSIADQIEAGTSSATVHIGATAFLGVEVASSSAAYSSGVAIEGVLPGTAAAAAGLSQGGTIVSVGGHLVNSPAGLQSVMQQYHPGDKVKVTWTDQYGQQQTSTVTLTAGPAE